MSREFEFLLGLVGEWKLIRNLPGAKGIKGVARFFQDKKNPHNLYYSESLSVPVEEQDNRHSEAFSGSLSSPCKRGPMDSRLRGNDIMARHFQKYYIFSYLPEQNKVMKNFYEDAWCELTFDFQNGKTRILLDYKCGEDVYKAVYDFLSSNVFTLNYDVKGPTKNYVIESIFSR